MLAFWTIKPDERIELVDGAIENPPERKPDFSITLPAFHRILEIGLKEIASEIGLSYFRDTIIDVKRSEKILIVLLQIDAKFNPAGAQTETRAMAEFYSSAIGIKRPIAVVCD